MFSFRRAVVTAVAALVPVLFVLPAGADVTGDVCVGFTDCTTKGHSDHGYQAERGSRHWDQNAGPNCTNYVAYRLTSNGRVTAKVPGLSVAKDWNNQVKKWPAWGAKLYRDPLDNDIAYWEKGYHGASKTKGHVAYVESVNEDGTITISEDNATHANEFQWRTVPTSDPSGYIRFDQATSDPKGAITSLRSSKKDRIDLKGYVTDPDDYDTPVDLVVRVYYGSSNQHHRDFDVRGARFSFTRYFKDSRLPSGKRKVRVYAVNAAGADVPPTLLTSRTVRIK